MSRRIALVTTVFALALAACSSGSGDGDDGGALDTRTLHRRIEEICANEVDVRAGEGTAADPGAFMAAAGDGDQAGAIDAASYNIEAMDRVADEMGGLRAADSADADALAAALDGLEARQQTWTQRHEQLESGEVELGDGDQDVLVEFIREGADTSGPWLDALEHFQIDDPDCTAAVP